MFSIHKNKRLLNFRKKCYSWKNVAYVFTVIIFLFAFGKNKKQKNIFG